MNTNTVLKIINTGNTTNPFFWKKVYHYSPSPYSYNTGHYMGYDIWGCHSKVAEDSSLLGCDSAPGWVVPNISTVLSKKTAYPWR